MTDEPDKAGKPDKKPEPRRTGRQIDVADAWIAATALLYGAVLVTHNAVDFNHLPGLQIITES